MEERPAYKYTTQEMKKKQDKCNKKTTKRKQQQQQQESEEQNQVKPINLKDTKTLPSNRGRDVNSALALTSTAAGTDSALDVMFININVHNIQL